MRGVRILLVVTSLVVFGNVRPHESAEHQQYHFTTIQQGDDIGPLARAIATTIQQGDGTGPLARAIATKGGFNRLTKRPCRSSGITGTCMYMTECLTGKGTPMGICTQGYFFGTCCAPSNAKPSTSSSPSTTIITSHGADHIMMQFPYPSSSSSTASSTSHGADQVMLHFPSPQPPAHTYPVFMTTRPTTISAFITTKPIIIHTTHGTTTGITTTTESTTITTPKTPTITTPKQKPTTSTTTARPTTSAITPKPTTTAKPTTMPKPTTTAKPTTTPKPTTTAATTTATETPKAVNILSKNECGLPYSDYLDNVLRDGRIVNGTDARFGEFPWFASLRRNDGGSGSKFKHNCGAAVLDKEWVITAAHCVYRYLKSQLRLRIGEINLATEQEPQPYVDLGVKKVIRHPGFDWKTFDNDIALLQLERPLNFQRTPHVAPICLPGSLHQLDGQNGTIAGWGKIEDGGATPKILQKATLPIFSNERCISMFNEAGRNEKIPEWFFCSGFETGQIDACQGDSGGPMVVQDASGRNFIGGIVSWGVGCARPLHPGVYTRVSHFMPWILQHVT